MACQFCTMPGGRHDDECPYDAEARRGAIHAMASAEYAKKPPSNQCECVAMAARISIAVNGPPSEKLLLHSARGLAAGLFGPAYEAADAEKRRGWDSMCADALRAEAE